VFSSLEIEEKKKIVAELQDKFARSAITIVTDYKGLDVASINSLRRNLREAEVEYKVVKNTLLRRASEDTDAALLQDYFKGPSAIALSYDDPVRPAKVLSDFVSGNNKLEIKAGVLNGKLLDIDGIKALSKLPSREVLLSQVLSAMNGVPTSLVSALNNVAGNFLNVLNAIADKKETV
jgi:large subunit ribosomal protein L10